jgi:hypothetical protein
MEISIKPNWSPQSNTELPGRFNFYKNTGTTRTWIYTSNDNLRIGMRLFVWQNGNVCDCTIVEYYSDPSPTSFFVYTMIVERTKGIIGSGTISKVEEVTDAIFYLDGVLDLKLNVRILDLKELKKSSTYTKTISVPFTNNNNVAFSTLFNINIFDGFNPKKKSTCYITDGGVLISSGYLQIQDIDTDNKIYQCVYYGENKNLFDDIGDKLIFGNADVSQDLNFENLSHFMYKQELEASWDGEREYVYGLMTAKNMSLDYSTLVNGIDDWRWKIHMRVKSVLDRMFAKYGYEYESDFLNSDQFYNLVSIPGFSTQGGDVTNYALGSTASSPTPYTITPGNMFTVPFDKMVVDRFGNGFDLSKNRFVIPFEGLYKINAIINFEAQIPTGPLYPLGPVGRSQLEANTDIVRLGFRVYRRGYLVYTDYDEGTGTGVTYPGGYGLNGVSYVKLDTLVSFRFKPGDEIEFYTEIRRTIYPSYTVTGINNSGYYRNNSYSFGALLNYRYSANPAPIFLGVKQSDFLGDVFKMFNLYIKPSKTNPRKFLIEPRDKFYEKGKVIDDLQYDVESINISYMNDLAAKKYTFTYTTDKDLGNDTFSKKYKDRVYGDAKIELDNDFINNEIKIQASSSPTFFQSVAGSVILPNVNDLDQFKNRFYYYNGKQDCYRNQLISGSVSKQYFAPKYITFDGASPQSPTYSYYPAFSNYTEFRSKGSDSILFAENGSDVRERSLYYLYYENEIETYADARCHILSIDVKMNAQIFNNIEFNDRIYLEINGNPQYYTILSIDNFNPDDTDIVNMKLLTYFGDRSERPKRARPSESGVIDNWDGGGDRGVQQGPYYNNGGGIIPSNDANTIINDGINGALMIGSNNAFVGSNKNSFIMADNVIIDLDVNNTFIFGNTESNIIESNIVAFGGSGKTFSSDTFNFNSYDPTLEKKDSMGVTGIDGRMVYDTNGDIMVYNTNEGWTTFSRSYTNQSIIDSRYIISTASTYYDIISLTGINGNYMVNVNLSMSGGSEDKHVIDYRLVNNDNPYNSSTLTTIGSNKFNYNTNYLMSITNSTPITLQIRTSTSPIYIYEESNMSIIRI